MKTLPQPSFFFIGEHELPLHLKNLDPIIKINLYGEKLEEAPFTPLYVKFIDRSKLKFNQLDQVIRAIIKDHAKHALAFQWEWLNLMNSEEGIFKNSSHLNLKY